VLIPVAIIVLLGLAAVALLATARRRTTTGRLSRETRRSDASEPPVSASPAVPAVNEDDLDDEARARAEESRRSAASSGLPVKAAGTGVVRYEPVDPEELGATRRQFFNRGILLGLSLGVGGFGAAALAFLWPSSAGGFGGKVDVGSVADIEKAFADKIPFYNASAKVYIVAFPKADLKKAAKVYPSTILAGMDQGYVALYQKCPHLGCWVPFGTSAQWFECPCHQSQYNRVGEKKGGPAPRGMDHFPVEVKNGVVSVDTGFRVEGAPIGVNTTGQEAEGPHCVGGASEH
jgi:cytochrome b6-f complex iron-sulfur subunit